MNDDTSIPTYVRVMGVLLAIVGFLSAADALQRTVVPRTTGEVAMLLVAIAPALIGGIGLAIGFRWAWFFAVIAASCATAGGIYAAFTAVGGLAPTGTWPFLVLLVLPGLLMLWSLFAPGTWAWLLQRPRAQAEPSRDVRS